MANNPRIDIGVRVDYKDVLKQMKSNFKNELTEISNHAQKTSFDANIEKKLKRIDDKVDSVFGGLEKRLDELSNQTVSTDNFEKFQKEVADSIASVKRSITGVTKDITNLRTEVGMVSGADFASDMKKQFDEVRDSMLGTCEALGQLLDLTNSSSAGLKGGVNSSALKDYKKTLVEINKYRKEMESLNFGDMSDDDIYDNFDKHEESMSSYMETYKKLKSELENTPKSSAQYDILENKLVQVQIAALRASETIQELTAEAENRGINIGIHPQTQSMIKEMKLFEGEIEDFSVKAKKIVDANKEAQNSIEQTQTAFSTFTIKNGAIHVPVEVATKSGTLQKQLQEMVERLQEYAKNNPVIAQVKLTLDSGSASGYKKNDDITKQLKDGQNEPAVDISKAIKKTYVQAIREAEKTAKDSIKAIQTIFNGSPIKITPNKEAFTEELSTMVSSSLGRIAEDTTGLNVNKELEKLVTNLKEVSSSLSGNENLKLGIDEASIERITTAIRDMADMIKRAFGVASKDDIDAQWAAIESKFKGVAGEEGKLLVGNKEHKAVIQELASEYKKYLDMGGTNDLSGLTKHTQTVKNITKEYEKLTAEAKEAQDVLDQNIIPKNTDVNLIPNAEAFRADAEKLLDAINLEKEINIVYSGNIKDTTKKNKKLETQADKTSVAIKGEGDSAQTAAGKFRKLAKEKGAAVVANRELAKAAKETADALEKESKARKSGAGKTNKNAVDGGVYEANVSTWQNSIKQSLLGSGYEEVYGGQLSRLESGVVKYTASVRDSEGAWKKLTATISSSGDIQSTKLQDLIEKEKEAVAKMLEKISGEEVKPVQLSGAKLKTYSDQVNEILKDLGELSGTTYKVDITNDGKLLIARREISDTGAEAEAFTITIDRIDDVLEQTADGAVVSSGKIKEALNGAFDSAKISKSTKDFTVSAQKAFDVFKEKAKRDSNFSKIESDLENLRQKIAGIKTSDDLVKFNQDLKDLGITLRNVGKDNKLGKIIGGNRTFKDINEVRANIDSLFASMGKVNEKSIRVTGTDKLTAEVKAANGEIRTMNVSLDSEGFARYVDAGIVQFGRLRSAAEGVFKGIKDMVRIYLSPADFIRYFKVGFDKVKEIDVSMTELRKVSDATPGELASYFDDAVVSAKNLGSSVNDMISATADWSRMGYNLPDSKKLGEVAVLYKNVGDGIDIEEANSSLVSTLQGFQMEASEAERIIDSFNEVSNNFAISSGGIGEALKRSAAAFNAANTDMNQAIALITAGNEVVQNPEKVGTMWQTVSARIRGTKSELEALGEETDNVISTSKLRDLVMGYTKVDIMEDENTYKDMYTIISEIGKEWDKLNDIDRAALLEALAGKKQSNTLAAVLNNYERLEKIYQTAENSAGSAIREQEKYKDSLGYSLDQLTAHGEEFWNTFINKDDVKDFIDLINVLISSATKLVDTFGSIPTVAGILGGFAAIKNVGRPKAFGLKILF